MKHFVSAVVTSLILTACGSSQSDNSELQASGKSDRSKKIADQIISIEGYVTDVGHLMGHPTPDHPGITKTFVTLEMPVGCLDKFASFSSSVTYGNGKATIHAAAYSLFDKRSLVAFCTAEFRGEKKTVTLDGYFAEKDIEVVWMKSQPVDVKKGDTGVYNISHAEIIDLKEICPVNPTGFSCKAIGSTGNVKLTLSGCLDRLGNVDYTVNYLGDGKAQLLMTALGIANEASTRARCAAMPVATQHIFVGYNLTKDVTTLKLLK